jgi:hypothetical protein
MYMVRTYSTHPSCSSAPRPTHTSTTARATRGGDAALSRPEKTTRQMSLPSVTSPSLPPPLPGGAAAVGGPGPAGTPTVSANGTPGAPGAGGAGGAGSTIPPPPAVWDWTQRSHLDLVFAYGAAGKWEWANAALDAGFPLSATNTADGATMLHVAVARVRDDCFLSAQAGVCFSALVPPFLFFVWSAIAGCTGRRTAFFSPSCGLVQTTT